MPLSSGLLAAASGLGIGLSLIVAIGAQNAFVLRQGLRRSHVWAVVVVCTGSDVVLISAGVAGVGAVVSSAPMVLTVVRYLGAAFLIGYGLLAARRAWRPSVLEPAADTHIGPRAITDSPMGAESGPVAVNGAWGSTLTMTRPVARPAPTLWPVVVTSLALTWLNPHVYLDTVVMLGGVANTHPPLERWFFGGGAILGSLVWFTALGYGARLLGPIFARPNAWRVLDSAIAVFMFGLAIGLVVSS